MTIREAAKRFLYEDLEERAETKAAEIRQEQVAKYTALGYDKETMCAKIEADLTAKMETWRRHRTEMIDHILTTYSIDELAELIGAK